MAKKKVAAIVKIQIPAGKASPAPPVGTALGPHGVAIMDFVKAYNAATENQVGTIVPVDITVFEDRSFTFVLKTPPTPVLLRERAGLEKASSEPGKSKVGRVTEAHIAEIAEIKMPDLNAYDLDAAKEQIRGTARTWASRSWAEPHRSTCHDPDDLAGRAHETRETEMSGKKHTDALKTFDRDQVYTPTEALGIVKEMASAKFDESVDVAVRLGVDPRKADQMVRGTVGLPAGTGKDVRVAVFAAGEAAQEAREAGADLVGADDLAAQVEAGKFDFDVAIATPDMMPLVGRLGRALGPRGLMPNPKTGTVTTDVGRAVTEFKGGKVEYRTDRYGNIHVPLGKASFEPAALETNFRAVIDELNRAKPAAAKGRYMRKITVSSTMGPGVRIDTNRLRPDTAVAGA